jgi:hypothetical protein
MTTFTLTLASRTRERLHQATTATASAGNRAVRRPGNSFPDNFVRRFLAALVRSLAVPAA